MATVNKIIESNLNVTVKYILQKELGIIHKNLSAFDISQVNFRFHFCKLVWYLEFKIVKVGSAVNFQKTVFLISLILFFYNIGLLLIYSGISLRWLISSCYSRKLTVIRSGYHRAMLWDVCLITYYLNASVIFFHIIFCISL